MLKLQFNGYRFTKLERLLWYIKDELEDVDCTEPDFDLEGVERIVD